MHKAIGILVGVFLMVAVAVTFFYYQTEEIIDITVTDKERITVSNGDQVDSKYLVFTEEETFENTDLLFKLKFTSSDLQGQLEVGQTYTVEVIGWRVPALSMYRNIVEIR